jgi:diadenosine tetraphosphate (Ap4A) HIT family hydrolase
VNVCPFCAEQIQAVTLWESEHYRVFADEYPRCVGHVLLITKTHVVGHADAPPTWLHELAQVQEHVTRFLQDTFGAASFWEHGGGDKEVPHAHLHGVPVDMVLGSTWLNSGRARRVDGWPAVQRYRQDMGAYVYAAGRAGAYLVLDEPGVLHEVRHQFVRQLGSALDAQGGLHRHGPEVVARTRELWRDWAQAGATMNERCTNG